VKKTYSEAETKEFLVKAFVPKKIGV